MGKRKHVAVSVGHRVVARVGSKGGEGVVSSVDEIGVAVDFGHTPYPESMVRPDGVYFVPRSAIIRNLTLESGL